MMMNVKRKLLNAVALLAMFSAFEANAQSADLDVSAVVPEACLIISPDPLVMDFGTVDPVGGSDGLGADYVLDRDFVFQCSQNTSVTVELDLGNGVLPTLAERFMQGTGANQLGYRLEQVGGANFGTGADGILFASTGGFGANETATIRGRLTTTHMQAAQVDSYSDQVTITLTL